MEGLTWRALLLPEYVMTFVEGFGLIFLASLGFNVSADGSAAGVLQWPGPPTFFAASIAGMLNGIRALRNLRSPAPANGADRRSHPTPEPKP